MKKPKFVAPLDLQLIDNDKFKSPLKDTCDHISEGTKAFVLGDSTYRHDGLTIGRDYLRVAGSTISRGQLNPATLSFEETIGRGAFSKVQRAIWDNQNKNQQSPVQVAIKQYSILYDPSHQRHEMLVQEVRSLAKMDSPCLIKLYGAFLEKEYVTVVLEYMDLGSLHHVIEKRSNAPMPENLLAALGFQMLSGLSYLHAQRIIHRDFKSENVLLHSNGSVKLCDFGLASLGDHSLCKTVVGTTQFMAPERLRAKPYGRSSDIWSLGLVLLHCATAKVPWHDINSIVDLIVTIEETPSSDLVPLHLEFGLREILLNTLQLDPPKRMPANILLGSPWFSRVHKIKTVQDAVKILYLPHMEQNDLEKKLPNKELLLAQSAFKKRSKNGKSIVL